MEISEVVRVRDKLKAGKDIPVRIIADNMQIINEQNDYVIWDDTNGIITVIRPNAERHINKKDISILCFDYTSIQYLETFISLTGATDILTKVLAGQKDTATIDKIVSSLTTRLTENFI
jgi:hypothetical protein